ncbi:MAG: armadillo-type protein [Benjaminiella poitrasii]|nr:MAG: armadillo-type protein [Benjaminiella poitrasii]
MTWQPQQQGLRELVFLLRDATNPNNPDQGLIHQRLLLFNEYPDYNSYLAHILTKLTYEDISIRRIAGLQLKNNIKNNFNIIPLSVLDYVKQCCIDTLHSSEQQPASICKTVSSVIASIVSSGQAHNWLEVIILLVEKLDNPNQIISEVALDTLVMICEDTAIELDQVINGNRPLRFMIPKFVELYSHPNSRLRAQAIYATSQFVPSKPESFIYQLDVILNVLYSQIALNSYGEDACVRREFIRIVSLFLELFPEKLEPHIDQTIEYMVNATIPLDTTEKDEVKEQILISACDFWMQYAQSKYYCQQKKDESHTKRYISSLVENLIRLMAYSETDLLGLGNDDNDKKNHRHSFTRTQLHYQKACINRLNDDDDQQSIRPRYYRPKNINPDHQQRNDIDNFDEEDDSSEDEESVTSSDSSSSDSSNSNSSSSNSDEDSSVPEDDDFEDDEFYSQDSLRKCSAAALDALAVSFGDDIAKIILDHLFNHVLLNENWLIRESGILALGAAAEGCINVFSQHLLDLVPYLLKSMQDSKALIRSISCWTLSRFSNWLVDQYDATNEEMCNKSTTLFEPVLFALLERLLDPNKRVQEAACTSFIIFCETASTRLVSYIYPILAQTNQAFRLYHRKNRLILYDAVGTFAESVGSELNQPQFISLLMPPLISKWNELSDEDTDLFPLLECLLNITVALGLGFIQYVEPVLTRCVKLISSTLQEQMLADQYPDEVMPPNSDFLIAALDLLSGIVQGLGAEIEPLITQTNPSLLSLLGGCIHNPVPEVLQSTFALVGYIAIACFPLLVPFLNDMMNEMVHALRKEYYNNMMLSSISVYNNALWAIGEIVMRWGQEAEPYIPVLTQTLVSFLTHSEAPSSIRENAMVALGRLGLACPQSVAPYLHAFIKPWLEKSLSVPEGHEKDSAFQGLCLIIKSNAKDAQKDYNLSGIKELYLLLVAISTLRTPSIDLLTELKTIVRGFHSITNSDEWNYTTSQLDPIAQKQISTLFVANH